MTLAKHLQNSPPPLIMFTLGSVLTVLWLTPQKRNICLSAPENSEQKLLTLPFPLKNIALCHTDSARNLGVIFDSNLNFKNHISSICRSSFFHIRQLRQIRSSRDKSSAMLLANALVHSKIDYCNSLLNGLPNTSTIRLQYVQNSLARVVCNTTKFRSHSASLLKLASYLRRHKIQDCLCNF